MELTFYSATRGFLYPYYRQRRKMRAAAEAARAETKDPVNASDAAETSEAPEEALQEEALQEEALQEEALQEELHDSEETSKNKI